MAKLGSEIPYSIVPEWLADSEISDRALRLYVILGRYAGGPDRVAWPSRTTLGRRLRCSVDSIDRAIRELREAGALEADHRFDDGRQTTNGYLLRMSAPVQGEGRSPAAPEGRTDAAQNESQKERENNAASAADAHPSKSKSDPRADVLVRGWWEAQEPRPLQNFLGLRQLVARALGAGYEPPEILAALDRCERPIVGWKLEQALTRRRAGAVRTEPTNPAARRWWENGS